MFDTPVIEVGLGMLLVFVLFSLLISAMQEMWVALMHSRGAALWDGIAKILGGGQEGERARMELYRHPLIKSLVPPNSWQWSAREVGRRTGPSYLPASLFASALIDLLRRPHASLDALTDTLRVSATQVRSGDTGAALRLQDTIKQLTASLPPASPWLPMLQRLRGALASEDAATLAAAIDAALAELPLHWQEAIVNSAADLSTDLVSVLRSLTGEGGSLGSFRKEIEAWFDESMNSVSGWYKRWTMAVQLGIGCVLAVAMNIDSVHLLRELSESAPLRQAMAVQADEYARRGELPARVVRGHDVSGTDLIVESTRPEEFVIVLPADVSDADVITVVEGPLADRVVCSESAAVQAETPAGRRIVCAVTAGELTERERLEMAVRVTPNGAPTSEHRLEVFLVPSAAREYEALQAALRDTNLPIGWSRDGLYPKQQDAGYGLVVLGWLLTALAGSLGAPFWFDLLKRVSNLRAAGPNPVEQAARS